MNAPLHLKVLVVDDHELVRAGMRRLLEENPQIEAIFEANSGEEALQLTATQTFDLVLMDIKLPGISGLEASDRMLSITPESRIIMVTANLDGRQIRKLLNSGVRGYVSKGSSAEEMDAAIRVVMSGEQYLSPDVAQQVAMETIKGDTEDPFNKLTSREFEIIKMLLRGLRNRQISEELHISDKTVSTHRTRAYEKLGIKTTAELVRLAMQHGHWNEE